VTTIHGLSSSKILPVYIKYNSRTFYASISDVNRCHELDYIATVRKGIDIEPLHFNDNPLDHLLFSSRFHKDNGANEAIQITKKIRKKLRIIGFVTDKEYFEKEVQLYRDYKQIIYYRHVDLERKKELFSNAYTLLHMINHDEAFELDVIEAMANGTL
jgi:glycosyltransferase involved in cell wall biosynthesis